MKAVANPEASPADAGIVVSIRGLGKSFGSNRVLNGVDLDVRRGEVVSVIGPSGSGKTTLLRCVNALESYDDGSIRLDGVEVGFDDANRRRKRKERELSAVRAETGMVFQMFFLFPHLTAAENVMLGLRKVRGKSKVEARAIAERWLTRVGLADKFDSYPSQLSGGQQQRVG
ncbi:MAG: amino acid ABC transporter ATP-binding protein, partial [Dongiaceae bacterium]